MNKVILYNEDIKTDFLDEYQDGTRTTYFHALKNVTKYEYKLNKDLYDFDESDFHNMFHDMNFRNLGKAERFRSVIEVYVNWTINNGYRVSNINPLSVFTKHTLEEFVGYKKLYNSEEELIEIEDDAKNKQDVLPLRLAFEGIAGEELVEQRYLKPEHIEGNIVHVHDQNGYLRDVEVSDRCIFIINETIKETEYCFQNGQSSARRNKGKLKETKYILKSLQTKKATDVIDVFVIYKRLRDVSQWFNYPLLSYKNIYKSGQIKMMVDYFNVHGEMKEDYLQNIAERFGINNKTVGNYSILPRTEMKKYINKENIEQLYEIEVPDWT